MSYIYITLKPHLCTNVIGMIENMVRWEGDANWVTEKNSDGEFIKRYGWDFLGIGLESSLLNIGPKLVYDPNFIGEKPIAASNEYPEYSSRSIIAIEHCLKKGDVYIPTSYPNVMFSYPYNLFKINERCYVFYRSGSNGCLYVTNSLQALYEKYMNDEEKDAFFRLEDLKN